MYKLHVGYVQWLKWETRISTLLCSPFHVLSWSVFLKFSVKSENVRPRTNSSCPYHVNVLSFQAESKRQMGSRPCLSFFAFWFTCVQFVCYWIENWLEARNLCVWLSRSGIMYLGVFEEPLSHYFNVFFAKWVLSKDRVWQFAHSIGSSADDPELKSPHTWVAGDNFFITKDQHAQLFRT